MPTGMSQTEYAKSIGVSRQYISKQVKKGVIRVKHGKIYPGTIEPKGEKETGEKVSISHSGKEDGKTGKGYWVVKTEVEGFNALLKELEYHKRIGTLVLATEVQRVAFDAARKVRNLLNTIPERLCQVLAAESDPVKVREVLTKEIRQAEDELADSSSGRGLPPGVRGGNPS